MEKSFLKKNEYKFYTMFLCVVFVVVILTNMIQSVFTVNTYEKQALENYYGYAANSLEQFSTSTDEIIRSAMSLAATLTFNTKINETVRSGQASSDSDMMKYVGDCMLIAPYVVDVAFFNPDMEKIYSVKGGYRKIENYWPGLSEQILMDLEKQRFAVRPTNVMFYTQELLTVAFPSDPYYDSYIIIDLNFDEIKRDFKAYAKQHECELYVTCFGKLLYQTEEELYVHTKSGDYIKNEYETLKIDDIRYVAVHIKQDTNGLQYTTLTKYERIKESYIMQNQIRFILVYLAILMVGLVILYLSMRYSFKPFHKIETGYRKLRDGNKKEDEKKQLLEFITFPAISEKTTDNVLEIVQSYLGKTDSLQLAMIVIDGYDKFFSSYTPEERRAYQFAIENICTEIISEYYRCMVIDNGENQKLFLIADTCEGEVIEKLFRISAEHIRNHLDFSVSVMLAQKNSFDNLYESYQELVELKNYRLVYPAGSVIISDLRDTDKEDDEEYMALMKEYVAGGRFSELPMLLDSYLRQLRSSDSSLIISSLTNLLAEIYEAAEKQVYSNGKMSLHTMMRTLLAADTIEDVKREFSCLFDELCQAEEEFSDNKYHLLVDSICKCIDENWWDGGFCVDTIAQKLKYSGVYLSRIFKYMTGESLSGKIMQRRLEESARLLSNSEISVKEVYEKCGFSSNSYFSVLFKKQYGVTPSVYRRSISQK